jgi:cytochrome c-type biogenesis protein CcmH
MNPQLLITIYKIASWIIEQLIQRRAESSPQAKAQKMQKRRASAVGSLIGTLMFFIGTLATSMFMCVDFVFAQDGKPVTDDQVNAVAKQLFCPICENIPLDVCPTQACAQWRDTIRDKLSQGWSEDKIKDYFVQQYGERVLAKPRTTGLSLYVWIIPPAAILIAALFFVFYMRNARMKAAAAPVTASPENEADDYAKKLEKELAKRR